MVAIIAIPWTEVSEVAGIRHRPGDGELDLDSAHCRNVAFMRPWNPITRAGNGLATSRVRQTSRKDSGKSSRSEVDRRKRWDDLEEF